MMWGPVLLVIYFLLALGFGLFREFYQPYSVSDVATLAARAIGVAVGLFALAGLIPALIWAIGQLRPEENRPNHNRAALALFLVLGVILAYRAEAGNRSRQNKEVGTEQRIRAERSEFSSVQRREFTGSTKS
jgi:hypothetical protein